MCLRVYKNSLFPRCWNVYFTLDSQEPAEERASITWYTHQLASKGSRGWRKDGGGSIELEVIVHASRSSPFAAHVETLNWETVRDEDACSLKRIKKNSVKRKSFKLIFFFPLQIIMSTTGKYSRAVCQSYRESSKSLKFKAYILL